MKRVILVLFSILYLLFSVNENILIATAKSDNNETTINENDLYARSAVLMDAESGRILYGKNCDEMMPMASTTKIMTLIVTLENANLDDVVAVSKYAASMPDVQLNIREGEKYYLKDLLYSLMLESHNDSAVAIAEYVGKNLEGFASLMNKEAKKIGCENSCFITPNGLDASALIKSEDGKEEERIHSTTSSDLARIMSYCIMHSPKKEEFIKITGTKSYSFSDIEGKRSFACNNHNAFLGMMDGALSGKTGFTSKAGYCYVGALRRDNRTFVVALLACGWPNKKSYKWSDTKKLMNYGINSYTYHLFEEVKIQKDKLCKIPVRSAQTDHFGDRAYAELEIREKSSGLDGILLKDGENIEVNYNIKKELEAPVKKEQSVGRITYTLGDEIWKEYDVYVKNEIEKIDYRWCLEMIINRWIA